MEHEMRDEPGDKICWYLAELKVAPEAVKKINNMVVEMEA